MLTGEKQRNNTLVFLTMLTLFIVVYSTINYLVYGAGLVEDEGCQASNRFSIVSNMLPGRRLMNSTAIDDLTIIPQEPVSPSEFVLDPSNYVAAHTSSSHNGALGNGPFCDQEISKDVGFCRHV